MIETRKIKFNRINISLRIILAFIMLGIGIWLAIGDANILNKIPKLNDPNFRKFMGYITTGLSVVGILFLFKCLITKKPGITVDQNGVNFQNTIFPKEISWNEIESIEKFDLKFFFLNWQVLKIILKYSDKPKLVSPFLLNISLDDLTKILTENFEKTTAKSHLTQ